MKKILSRVVVTLLLLGVLTACAPEARDDIQEASTAPSLSVASEEPEPNGTEYVLNTNSKKFHLPSCKSVKQMSDKNKGYFTGTRGEVIVKGYSPCGNCDP